MKIAAAAPFLGSPSRSRGASAAAPSAESERLDVLPPLENPDQAVGKLAVGFGYVEFPQISPDGKKLVFNVVGDYKTSQMLIMDADGGKARSLLDRRVVTPETVKQFLSDYQDQIQEQGTFTEDGRSLYFRTNERGTFGIGRYDLRSGGTELVLHDPRINMKHPVELDDHRIACYGGPPSEKYPTVDQYTDLFIADVRTGERQMLTHSNGQLAYKHPSLMHGQLLAHVEPAGAQANGTEPMSDILLIDPASGEQSNLTRTPEADERHPFYNEAMDLLVYHRKADGEKNLVLSTPDGSRSLALTRYGKPAQSPCWSPDGTRIYFVKKRERQPDGEPFFNRQADIRVLDVPRALKDLTRQAKHRLKVLEKQDASESLLERARQEYEDCKFFRNLYR
ncbi:MAG: PD40 domain-containing protein [Armatimonadetes bacterium]|nr:PD40 domain-containing protein [Armatimonadota bacterium]